jgi:hypothetical protein
LSSKGHRLRKRTGASSFELFASLNCWSIETWLKISLNAKLSLKPPVSALVETERHVKIETSSQLVFLGFIQLCCVVLNPLAIK